MRRLLGVCLVGIAVLGAGCGRDKPARDDAASTTTSSSTTTTVATTTTTINPEAEKSAALAAWDAYKKAVLGKDGKATSPLVSEGTIAQYETARQRALTQDKVQLERQDVMDIVLVMSVRKQFTAAQLEPLDGRTFFELAISEGLVDPGTVRGVSFTEVELDSFGTRGHLVASSGSQAVRRMPVRKEGDTWKVDLGEFLSEVGAQLRRAAHDQGKSSLDAAIELLGLSKAEADRLMRPLKG